MGEKLQFTELDQYLFGQYRCIIGHFNWSC